MEMIVGHAKWYLCCVAHGLSVNIKDG